MFRRLLNEPGTRLELPLRASLSTVWLLAAAFVFSGCAALHPIRGIPASHAPSELLAESREGQRTINLGLLVQSKPAEYRVAAGDILAVYIPGVLGPQTVIGPALGAQVVGETPPITPAANTIDPPTLGYPLAIRDDNTLVLPQLGALPVGGMTLREVEMAIQKACHDAQILQEDNARILVSLWRPREYRVLVVRQETAAETSTMPMLGMINQGHSKRGTGHITRLRAYENDVLHALMGSEIGLGGAGATGLPGLDAENAIYIIRRNGRRGACPAEAVDLRMDSQPQLPPAHQFGPTNPPGQSPSPAHIMPQSVQQQPLPQQYPPQEPLPQQPAAAPLPAQQPAPYQPESAAAPSSNGAILIGPSGEQRTAPAPGYESQPQATPQPYVPGRYGTPQNGMPILPQSYQVIRGQNYRRSLFSNDNGFSNSNSASTGSPRSESMAPVRREHSFAEEATMTSFAGSNRPSQAYYEQPSQVRQPPVQQVSSIASQGSGSYRAEAMPSMEQQAPEWSSMSRYAGMPSQPAAYNAQPAGAPSADFGPYSVPASRSTYAMAQPAANSWQAPPQLEAPSVPESCPPQEVPDGQFFPSEFGFDDFTIDNPNVIRIPVRLGPGQSPNITEEDIKLYDGDIVFIESRDSEVFYTGGLLGGGEYLLPRDRDLRVTEAISVAQARVTSSGAMTSMGGVSALNGDVSVSPSRVIIRRRLEDGRTVPIEVDLYRARLHPEEDILIQPRDLILLQFTCGEATLAFIERHILAGALFSVAASSLSTGSR
jgi:hypothetical protein